MVRFHPPQSRHCYVKHTVKEGDLTVVTCISLLGNIITAVVFTARTRAVPGGDAVCLTGYGIMGLLFTKPIRRLETLLMAVILLNVAMISQNHATLFLLCCILLLVSVTRTAPQKEDNSDWCETKCLRRSLTF